MSTRICEKPQTKVLQPDDLEDKVCVVVGTRPGIIMFSPIIRELERRSVPFFILHTGQHYSYNMDRAFFHDLGLEEPGHQLETMGAVGYTYHGEQTGFMLMGCERVLLEERPQLVLVGGDANTNLAGAIAARKLGIKVGHVEAGERSYDWRMPEEHNRRMIDHISDYLFATNETSHRHLVAEDVRGQIDVIGNPIVDAALQNLEIARGGSVAKEVLGSLYADDYCVLTLHREENVDVPDRLLSVLEGVVRVSRELETPIVFLQHPRVARRIAEFGFGALLGDAAGIAVRAPVGYLGFLSLLDGAALVLTDSGGVQQEAYILRRPCVTLRDTTEWACTLHNGCNHLAGTTVEGISQAVHLALEAEPRWGHPFGDGRSAERIVDIVTEVVRERATANRTTQS